MLDPLLRYMPMMLLSSGFSTSTLVYSECVRSCTLYVCMYVMYRTNETLNESNEIAGLQKRLELSGREVLLLQNELDNKISNMSDRTLEMGQVIV